MSRLAPRNASVQILKSEEGLPYVHKQYHAVYTAIQEQDAYNKLEPLLKNIPGIRLAQILSVDENENSLNLEYVLGKSLYEMADQGIFEPLKEHQEHLISLFIAARNAGIHFDSDPSNFIVHSKTDRVVCIDPVCTDIQLEDYAAVVFIWGLVKLILRSPKFWRYPPLIRIIRSYSSCYLAKVDVSPEYFNQQMASYITTVINWNKQISPVDGPAMIFLRRCIAIPLYSAIRCLFRLNLVS